MHVSVKTLGFSLLVYLFSLLRFLIQISHFFFLCNEAFLFSEKDVFILNLFSFCTF